MTRVDPALVEREFIYYAKVAWNECRRRKMISEVHDLLQEVRLALWQFEQAYDPGRNDNFGAASNARVKGVIYDYFRRNQPSVKRQKVSFPVQMRSLDSSVTARLPSVMPIFNRMTHELPPQWKNLLNKRELIIFELYFEGSLSKRAVGERIGISESRVHQIIEAASKRIRDLSERKN